MRLALLVLLIAALPAAIRAVEPPSFQELEESLTCQCGCGLTVHACNHLQCPSAVPLRQEIREQMAQGLSKDQILAHFQQKYGEKILSSPTTSGLNLAAWIMPFVILLIGGAVVVVTLRRWRRAPARSLAAPGTSAPAEPRSDLERELQRELDRYDA